MKLFRIALCLLAGGAAFAQPHHWTEAEANDWYARQPWLVGSNYIPSTAVNQLEMWQAATFDPLLIDRELGWAQSLGMNTMRVFLHDVLYWRDPSGFEKRINAFLKIADKHKIRPIFVLFDSCWDPFPEYGQQRAPKPGVHNSRWVQSPGAAALMDPNQTERLLAYVQGIIADFGHDKRILAWDLWNEPENTNAKSYPRGEVPNKAAVVAALLPKVFEYARAGVPEQPLTSGLWQGDWSSPDKLSPVQKIQVEQSDIISFHNYGKPDEFEKRVKWLQAFHRPIFCTEYMARTLGSTFQGILPIAKQYHVAAINWGFVTGKTQTDLPWDSWQHPYPEGEPKVWFHDILRPDGRPYSVDEVEFIRQETGWTSGKGKKSK